MKTVTKTQQAIDYLELISKPSTLDIIAVSEKVKCSRRLVWGALRKIREKNEEISQEFHLVKEIASDLIWITAYMEEEMKLQGELKIRDKIRLNQISAHIELLKKDLKLQDYIRIKEEKEIQLFLKDIEGRRAKELQEYIKLKEELASSD